ncbi:hypothetical protein CWI38_0710p0020 [Hamiltosporidium tvaerminnensis]|uniref:Uncharacterized protein n=1 Tax=Hamiltosporidium tvaerminnensis TaxID=1176355 RepID=A0A4V2JXP1_9MICR|nr:hypothetical protein CWI38_0710p0020 [Hamiltosporidium tvaerminnensis]
MHNSKKRSHIEIASYVHEEFTETVTTTTTIIIDDLEIDFKIRSDIKICDVDVAMLFERLLPQPTIDNNTPFSNTMENLNTDAILEGNRRIPKYAILAVQKGFERMPRNSCVATLRHHNEKIGYKLDIDAQKENIDRRRIATFLTDSCTLTTQKYAMTKQHAKRTLNRSKEKHSNLKKIMQELYSNLSSVSDLSETQVMKNESLNKETIPNRKSYLSKHEVIRDEIVSFWSTMWNNNETVSINDFLLDFVLENHPTMFPSLDEFVNFINLLPN